ncbi:MAG: glycosyltransferase family 2 protein [Myxococcales bacterium]|jgi:glycosyltransferase involved in cell wall biosynthesis|nr:glycosyltransferase family 2 protein [Myxococcales bacterium]
MTRPRYVLVTAAYNEERHIADTLRSVVNQTLTPRRWVVVSDGCTDRTDEIVEKFADEHPFIELLRVQKADDHNFANKVRALRRGFGRLAGLEYDFIGVLDADLSFEPDYFERLLERLASSPRLGVAGGNIEQLVDGTFVPRLKDLNSVAGAVQLLRRDCFEQTGGLPALRYGGEDAAMEIAARMHGWETRTFPELRVVHFGLVGAGTGGPVKARMQWGRRNFNLGYHPLFQLARCAYRVQERPYVLASLAELAGFIVGKVQDREPSVDPEVVHYLRREQLGKLRHLFKVNRSK